MSLPSACNPLLPNCSISRRKRKTTLEMYGVNQEPTHPYAVNCLLARRMVERGVRFVLVSHGSWDDHNDLDKNLKKNCDITDKPAAALLADLKQRGLLGFDSRHLGWRIRTHAHDPAAAHRYRLRAGPSSELFQHVARRRRRPRQARLSDELTISGCKAWKTDLDQRPPGNDPAFVGFRPHQTHVSITWDAISA